MRDVDKKLSLTTISESRAGSGSSQSGTREPRASCSKSEDLTKTSNLESKYLVVFKTLG